MKSLTLYHFPPSFYSQLLRLMLVEKGVEWESRLINIGPPLENYEPWYAKINPEMTVPTVQFDGKVYLGTLATMKALEKEGLGRSLTPESPEEQESMYAWLEELGAFPMRELSYGEGARRGGFLGWLAGVAMVRRRKKLTRLKEENPDLREVYQAKLEDMNPWEETMHDPGAVEKLFQRMQNILDKANDTLEQHPWLAGKSYSLADVWLTVLLSRLVALNKKDWVESRPVLLEYYKRVVQRPSFDKADVWNRLKPEVMAPIILRIVWPGLLVGGLLLGGGLWWWLR